MEDIVSRIEAQIGQMRHGRLVNFMGRGTVGILLFQDHAGRFSVALGDRTRISRLTCMLAGDEAPAGGEEGKRT